MGCRSVDPNSATQFGKAAGSAKQQAELAFASVNALTQSNIIAHAARQETLDDENFFSVLPASERDQWLNAFSILESYGGGLAQLSSFKSDAELENSLVELGQQLQKTADFEVPPGVLVGVAKLGGKLIEAKARQDARRIAQAADPDVQAIMNAMAEAVGTDPEEALRATVKRNFNQLVLSPIDRDFVTARLASDAAAKMELAVRYGHELDNREAIDRTLAGLRRSILDLGRAHQALAQGRAVDVVAFAKMVTDELLDAKRLLIELEQGGTKP